MTDIEVDDESYHYAEIMGRDDVTLYFSLPQFFDFPIGSYIMYGAPDALKPFSLYSVDKMRMEHRRDYEYTITFESEAVELGNYIFSLVNPFNSMWGVWRPTSEGDFKFPYASTAADHVRLIADCMTFKTGVTWSVGTTVDGGTKLINYDTMTCLDALRQIADEFGTEYSIENRTINLGKVEHFKDVPLTISYGKGNGLRPGIEKTVDGGVRAIGKVYVQGTERNIDRSEYGSSTLHLPTSFIAVDDPSHPGQTISVDRFWWYDGNTLSATQFEGAKKFTVPQSGSYVKCSENNSPLAEGAIDLSEIYPHETVYIDSVEEEDAEKNWWNIYSSNFTAGASVSHKINYGDCLIVNGEQMSIIFQDGNLAGRQFGVEWATKEDPLNEGQMIAYMKIVPSEQDGIKMPNSSGFDPRHGDHIIVFNCYLPEQYIRDAEMEMLQRALEYLWENMTPRFSIKGEVDPIWSASRWLNIGAYFAPGAYLRFVDPTWQNDGVLIRVNNVKTFINKPHQPIVELSSGITKQGVVTALKKMEAQRVATQSASYGGRSFTKRTFADAKETMELLIQAGLDGFEPPISPITVQTMQLLVGSEPLQFVFIASRNNDTRIDPPFAFNPTTKKMEYTACALQHMTMGIEDIRPKSDTRQLSEYLIWDIASGQSAVLDEPSTPYYLYVKCDADNDGVSHLNGQFHLSATAIDMGPHTEIESEVEHHYYYFLAAIINAEREGNRSYGILYGFTEVLPGQITTDLLRGSLGGSWWDLATNEVHFGDKFIYHPSNGLRLKNALTVSSDGLTVTEIGAWCGTFDSTKTYGKGDEVVYTVNGVTSTYRYINATSSLGSAHPPTDTDYWQVIAKGVKGADGDDGEDGNGIYSQEVAYWHTTTLDGTSHPVVPSGGRDSDYWVDEAHKPSPVQGEYIWQRVRTSYTMTSNVFYTYTATYCAEDGTPGSPGTPGPWLNTRGTWSNSATYKGSSESCDVVYYNGVWYRALSSAGSFGPVSVSTTPDIDSSHWTAFESNFSNIATGLLYTSRAYVDNLYVKDLETAHTANGYIKSVDNYLMMIDMNGKKKLYITGENIPAISTGSYTSTISSVTASVSGRTAIANVLVAGISIANADNQVILPDLQIEVRRYTGEYDTLELIAEYVLDGESVSSVVVEGVPVPYNQEYLYYTLPGTSLSSLSVTSGSQTHSLYIRISAYAEVKNLYSVKTASGSYTIDYKTENVVIGANGLRAAWSNTCFAEFVKNNNDVVFTLRNESAGLRLTSSRIEKWNGTSWEAASL